MSRSMPKLLELRFGSRDKASGFSLGSPTMVRVSSTRPTEAPVWVQGYLACASARNCSAAR